MEKNFEGSAGGFGEDGGGKIREILDWHSRREDRSSQEAIVEMLREIQEICGYLPESIQQEAAGASAVSQSVIKTLIRFCPDLKSVGYRHVLTVCTGERCGNRQGAEVLEAVRRVLHVGKDGVSADKNVMVTTRNCLKHCKTAPNLLLDGKHFGGIRPEDIPDWIKKHCR